MRLPPPHRLIYALLLLLAGLSAPAMAQTLPKCSAEHLELTPFQN